MSNVDLLYPGLCALARCHVGGTMAGHLGAAVVAGHFFLEEHPELEPAVALAIRKEIGRVMSGEEDIWYNQEKAGISIPDLFLPFTGADRLENGCSRIADAARIGMNTIRQSGHNLIFASLALKALCAHPEYASKAIVEGIETLMLAFANAGPGRGYYGKERGWLAKLEDALKGRTFPEPYQSLTDLCEVTLREVAGCGTEHRQGFGGLFHLINHAAAIYDLDLLGRHDLAEDGLHAHLQHLALWRSLPDLADELGPLVRSEKDPLTSAYWSRRASVQWSGWLTHRTKTLYGYDRIRRYVADETLCRDADAGLRYLMA